MLEARKFGFLLCETAGAVLWLVLALIVCPAAGIQTAAMLACIWIFVRFAAHLLHLDSDAELWTLLGGMIFLGILLIINVDFFLSHPGASEGQPYLANHDSARYWSFTTAILTPRQIPLDTFINYSYLTSLICSALGFLGVLGFNTLCVMLTVCFTGRIARECSLSQNSSKMSVVTMLMLLLSFNYIAHGSVLLKDAVIVAAFSGFTAMLLIIKTNPKNMWAVIAAILACATSIFVRALSAPMFLIIIFLLTPWKKLINGQQKRTTLIFALLAIGCISLSVSLNTCMHSQPLEVIKGYATPTNNTYFSESNRGSSLTAFINNYPHMPVWQRIAVLPLTCALQLFLPLPWTYLRHIDYGPSMMLAHMGLPLYLEAGLVIYFFIFAIRKAPAELTLTSSGALALYIVMAYTYGGTVSRYALMLLPLLLPAGAWILVNYRQSRSLKTWMTAYTLLLVLALGAGMYLYKQLPSGNDLLC